jgi:arylformamidase
MHRSPLRSWLVSLALLSPTVGLTAGGSPEGGHAPWESWDRETMGRAYNAAAAVPESAAMFKAWVERSKAFRAAHAEHLDLVYGPRDRNRIDYFSAGPGTPVLAFLHGGWWQLRAKEDFAFVAESFVAEGVSVAMVGYPLAPDATMDEIVADTHTAIRYLAAELPRLGGDPRHLVVSGWSAGGHLTTMVLEEPTVHAGVSISGLFDLRPLLNSYINDKLHMDADMAERNSPQFHLPARSKRLELFVGGSELPEMIRQSKEYAAARTAAGLPAHFQEIRGANHYMMLDDMASPDGELHRAILSALH